MVQNFAEYIRTQADVILESLSDDVKSDPDKLRIAALAWIEKNAENFRECWQGQRVAALWMHDGDNAAQKKDQAN